MGYTTDFDGKFDIEPRLKMEDREFLLKFNATRRMARKVHKRFGVQGEWYVLGGGQAGQNHEENIIDYNTPPSTQPGLWCGWTPNLEGTALVWDGREKFYEYITWLKYLIEKYFKPRGYVLNGEVSWQGEESDDFGIITVKNNVIKVREGKKTFGPARLA